MKTIVREALLEYRRLLQAGASMIHATESERELAALKVSMIDDALEGE